MPTIKPDGSSGGVGGVSWSNQFWPNAPNDRYAFTGDGIGPYQQAGGLVSVGENSVHAGTENQKVLTGEDLATQQLNAMHKAMDFNKKLLSDPNFKATDFIWGELVSSTHVIRDPDVQGKVRGYDPGARSVPGDKTPIDWNEKAPALGHFLGPAMGPAVKTNGKQEWVMPFARGKVTLSYTNGQFNGVIRIGQKDYPIAIWQGRHFNLKPVPTKIADQDLFVSKADQLIQKRLEGTPGLGNRTTFGKSTTEVKGGTLYPGAVELIGNEKLGQAFIVHDKIEAAYHGKAREQLGIPVSDAEPYGQGGLIQKFEHGTITMDSPQATPVVHSDKAGPADAIAARIAASPKDFYGSGTPPKEIAHGLYASTVTSMKADISNGHPGWVEKHTTWLVAGPTGGAFIVEDKIRDLYAKDPAKLGAPLGDAAPDTTGAVAQRFEHGVIVVDSHGAKLLTNDQYHPAAASNRVEAFAQIYKLASKSAATPIDRAKLQSIAMNESDSALRTAAASILNDPELFKFLDKDGNGTLSLWGDLRNRTADFTPDEIARIRAIINAG